MREYDMLGWTERGRETDFQSWRWRAGEKKCNRKVSESEFTIPAALWVGSWVQLSPRNKEWRVESLNEGCDRKSSFIGKMFPKLHKARSSIAGNRLTWWKRCSRNRCDVPWRQARTNYKRALFTTERLHWIYGTICLEIMIENWENERDLPVIWRWIVIPPK